MRASVGTRRGNREGSREEETPLDIIAFLTAVDDVSLDCDGRNDFASGVGFGGLTCKAKSESTLVMILMKN